MSASSRATASYAAPFAGAFPFAAAGAASEAPLRIYCMFGLLSETKVVGHWPVLFR